MFCRTNSNSFSNTKWKNVERLQQFKYREIKLKINEFHLKYNKLNGNWECGGDKLREVSEEEREKMIKKLKKSLESKNKELDEIERIYLAKLTKLYLMIQTHCDMKEEMKRLFEEYGVEKRSERSEGDNNNNDIEEEGEV
jgi:hypothetical protein